MFGINYNPAPPGLLSARFADGTVGFFDPADGTYYDDQLNDITGYVQNFGGASIGGPADPRLIAAGEGITGPPTYTGLPPGPSPRVPVPPPSPPMPVPSSIGAWLTSQTLIKGVPNWGILAGLLVGTRVISDSFSSGRRR